MEQSHDVYTIRKFLPLGIEKKQRSPRTYFESTSVNSFLGQGGTLLLYRKICPLPPPPCQQYIFILGDPLWTSYSSSYAPSMGCA